MALKKPLVLNNGQIEQLQTGDFLQSTDLPQLTNGNASPIVIGTAVYASAANTVDKARANSVGTTNVVGLVADASIASSSTGGIQIDGVLSATTGQWDAVTGGSGGLTVGSYYYLSSSTAGLLTSTAPTATGEFVISIGIALSSTELKIEIQPRIKL
jgi:hypothetical protein